MSKFCGNCGRELPDNAVICTYCGKNSNSGGGQGYGGTGQTYYAPPTNNYDHTSEFDQKDISENKIMAMLCYLCGWIGIIICLLAASNSPYATFHLRQALKFSVVNILMTIIAIILCWTFIVPFAWGVMTLVLWVIRIICFFQICSGKAKEPPIIRSLGFLR